MKPYLRKCVEVCESLRNHISSVKTCETFSISAKQYLRKLAKVHAFQTHELRNLAKDVFIASHPPCSGRACSNTRHFSLVILNVFRLFVITIPKPVVSAVFLSFVCPNCFTIQVCQLPYDEIQSQLHNYFKCIGSCVIYLT